MTTTFKVHQRDELPNGRIVVALHPVSVAGDAVRTGALALEFPADDPQAAALKVGAVVVADVTPGST